MLNDYIPNKEFKLIIIFGSVLLALYFIKMALNYFIQYVGHLIGVKMQAQMRSDMFHHLQTLPYSFYDNHETGKIMARMTNDLNDISELAHHGPENVIISSISIVASFIYLATINIYLTLIIFVCVPFLLIISFSVRKKMRDARELMSDSKAWIEQSEDGAFAVKEETKGLKESRRDLDASSDSALAILLPFANAFREALVETFSSVLSESCYGALDFLIYEIKTGAAEDIPAATLAAEAKKNLNVLDEAVTASHEKIKMDFDADSDELSDEIGAELSVLEGKLSARLGDVLLKIERSRLSDFGGASAVREELEKSCRTAHMLKAFAACAECTSRDLASAVEYLCADEK
jgi:ABC-type multidrug transport system fused ATPase/permease subunit